MEKKLAKYLEKHLEANDDYGECHGIYWKKIGKIEEMAKDIIKFLEKQKDE